MNKYLKMKKDHQKELNNFPMFFAFSNKQFDEGMQEFGLDPEEDTDKIYSIGRGGFIKKKNSKEFAEMFKRHHEEIEKAIESDQTGEEFIFDMFLYELRNHEYIVTGNFEDTLDAVGLTFEEVKENEKLEHGLIKAKNKYIQQFE